MNFRRILESKSGNSSTSDSEFQIRKPTTSVRKIKRCILNLKTITLCPSPDPDSLPIPSASTRPLRSLNLSPYRVPTPLQAERLPSRQAQLRSSIVHHQRRQAERLRSHDSTQCCSSTIIATADDPPDHTIMLSISHFTVTL